MMRRSASVLVLAVSWLLVVAPSASALCTTQPFDQAIHQADAVWWGTVTDATPSDSNGNNWTLTVRIADVLKGHEAPGDISEFLYSFCGPYLTREEGEKRVSEQLIGKQQLFVGEYVAGGLGQISDFFTPQGLSPTEQYQQALKDLGLQAASRPRRTFSPSPLAPLAAGGFPLWAAVIAAALVVLIVVGAFVVARRRRATL